MLLALLALAGTLLAFVSLLTYLLLARALAIPLVDGSFGFGPTLARFPVLGVPITLRALPLGCFVRPWAEDADATTEQTEPRGRPLAARSVLVRATFALLPLLLTATLALVFHGTALPHLLALDGGALVRGAASPFGGAQITLEAAATFARAHGPAAFVLRLLPVATLGQVTALTNLGTLAGSRPPRGLLAIVSLAMLLPLVVLVSWSLALVRWLWG